RVRDTTLPRDWSFAVSVSDPNTPPTISSIANQTISAGGSTGPLAFTVSDAQTPLTSLTVSASSSNPTLVPNANIVLGGSGGNRKIGRASCRERVEIAMVAGTL